MNPDDFFIKESIKGRAVFAGKDIKTGEIILEFLGEKYTKEEYLNLHDPHNNHFLQVDDELFLGPSGNADDLINHSCSPNCGIKYERSKILLVAIKNISLGEELTFDYSTTMDDDPWQMTCCCGEETCRKIIRDFRLLKKEEQEKYISLGVVPPFILKKLANERR